MAAIKWTGPKDDKTAQHDGYLLRAEMLEAGIWWYGVYMGGEDVHSSAFDTVAPTTGAEAKAMAEKAMREHMGK